MRMWAWGGSFSALYWSRILEVQFSNTKVNNFLETANLSSEAKNKINELSSDCKNMHNMGMDVAEIDSCKEAMNMVKVY